MDVDAKPLRLLEYLWLQYLRVLPWLGSILIFSQSQEPLSQASKPRPTAQPRMTAQPRLTVTAQPRVVQKVLDITSPLPLIAIPSDLSEDLQVSITYPSCTFFSDLDIQLERGGKKEISGTFSVVFLYL